MVTNRVDDISKFKLYRANSRILIDIHGNKISNMLTQLILTVQNEMVGLL